MARQPGHIQIIESVAASSSGNSTRTCQSDTARTIEAWITVTATSSGDFNFELQSGLKSADVATDANWKTIESQNNITAVGTYCLLAARETDPLGELLRIKYTRNAGTLTFRVDILIKED